MFYSSGFISSYGALSFNLMQGYTQLLDHDDACYLFGGFKDSLSSYTTNLGNMLSAYNGSQYFGQKSMMLSREKILRPALGQRSTYYAKYRPDEVPGLRPGYGFTCGTESTGRIITDEPYFGGNSVKVCQNGIDQGNKYIVYNLYENHEQTNYCFRDYNNNNHGVGYYLSDTKEQDYRWFVIPRMRIDSNYAKNPGNYDKNVVRIEIYNFSGNLINSIDISCRNFLNFYGGSIPYYNGSYLENEYSKSNLDFSVLANDLSQGATTDADGRVTNISSCQVDYRIYWYGEVDVWLDYIRVEDEWAHYLFHPELEVSQTEKYNFVWKMNQEINSASIGSHSGFGYFYVDECEYNNFPCIAEVNRLIKQTKPNSGLICALNEWYITQETQLKNPPNYSDAYDYMVNTGAVTDILLTDIYPFDDVLPLPPGITLPNASIYPGTVNYHQSSTKDIYNDLIQYYIENGIYYSPNLIISSYADKYRKCATTLKNHNNISCGIVIQTFADESGRPGNPTAEASREPTNEEIKMQGYFAMCYGAKKIFEFGDPSFCKITPSNDKYFFWGLTDTAWYNIYHPGYPFTSDCNLRCSGMRMTNYYGQPKFDTLCRINAKLKQLGEYLYPSDDVNKHFTYDNTITVNTANCSQYAQHLPYSYIYDIRSLYTSSNPGLIPCQTDNVFGDCPDNKYWEIGFFNPPSTESQYSKYFLILNKRCAPYLNANDSGDRRRLQIKFNTNSLAGFNNWKLINAITGTDLAVFNKNNNTFIEVAEIFEPGEGKLIKLVPVLQEGGTLVCDENINTSITCKQNVYNNGYDITMGTSTNITFSESAGIYMTGGNLTIGGETDNPSPSHLQFTCSGNAWSGFILNACNSIHIYGAYFYKIINSQPAISISNSYHYRIENCHFVTNSENSNGLYIYYTSNNDNDNNSNNSYHYISKNIFNCTSKTDFALQITANASQTIPVLINSNNFNSSYGMSVCNISGGSISQNSLTDCLLGINLISSDCDFYQNSINSSAVNSIGIQLNIGKGNGAVTSNGYFVGGYNNFSNTGSNSKNISVINSYFDIDNGFNVFNINFNNSPRHITGYFPSAANLTYNATYNCYENNTAIDTPSIYVTQGDGGSAYRIIFNTDPTSCNSNANTDFDVFSLAGGVNDTVYRRLGGNGGGYKEGQAMAIEVQSAYNTLRDSISINIRKHLFSSSELQCKEMLIQYPDSIENIGTISKLYLSSLSLDSAGSHILPTKTFMENLILNNPNNTPLIKRANYYVQKCKVELKQYTSALQGFQEIINQNPYSYEGLVASWDYSATQLLANSSGGYQEELIEERGINEETNSSDFQVNADFLYVMLDTLKNRKIEIKSYVTGNYDSKIFTIQDREIINTNVTNAFKDERSKQIQKLNELEKKITTLTESSAKEKSKTKGDDFTLAEAKKELKIMKTLSDVVKTKKPKNLNEHIKNINSDIKKVFGTDKTSGNKNSNTMIPQDYSLSQNYPNPFNPVTKINYELPKDGKVRLVIYDILGRQIKSLVNNEFKTAGRYTVEFNGSQFASGVYFYRIQVEGGKGYTAVKKMVLVK